MKKSVDRKGIHQSRKKLKTILEWLKEYNENILEDNSVEELIGLFKSMKPDIKTYTVDTEIYYLVFVEILFYGLINNEFERKTMEESLDAIVEGAEFIQREAKDMYLIIVYLLLLAFYQFYYRKDIKGADSAISEYYDIVTMINTDKEKEYIALFRDCMRDGDYDTVLDAFKWKMKAMFQSHVDALIDTLERSNNLIDGMKQELEEPKS